IQAGQAVEFLRVLDPLSTTTVTLVGNDLSNILIGNNGANILIGGQNADSSDTLQGKGGNDTLFGVAGNDVLTGDAGADNFVFNTTPNAATNKDTVTDFTPVDDTFQMGSAVYHQLGSPGALNPAFFHNGTAAAD